MGAAQLVSPAEERVALLQSVAAEIRYFCAAHNDPHIVAKYAKYFVEGYDAYGVPEGDMHAQREKWYETYSGILGLEGFLDLGDLLWASHKYEEGFLAIFFVGKFSKEFHPETFERMGRWFDFGVGNWAHCDVLCGQLLSDCLTRRLVTLDAIAAWRNSPRKYKRRAVPVTMLPLLRSTQDVGQLLDFIRPLMLDDEKVVRQGLGWFLREAWKREPEPVEAFLLEWKDTAPRLIFQYATEKMTPEKKARFRKAK